MQFKSSEAILYVPDDLPPTAALARTTHLGIGAHQDDLEIMAIDGILQCYQRADQWFSGVVVTNGAGSSRIGLYGDYTDAQMMQVRITEQKKAAYLGEYAAQVLLGYPSSAVKDSRNSDPVDDLLAILQATRPQIVYTHNLADKHATHVGVALKVLAALRRLAPDARPQKVYGCEVWRDLDWMIDEDKVAFNLSARESLQAALVGVFDSQITGGKRYDLATLGRRRAHATYHASHASDMTTGTVFAMDLTPLVHDPSLDVIAYVQGYIQRFGEDVRARIASAL